MKNLLSLLFLLVLSISTNAQNEEFGLASFYSDKFDGGKTAYGDTYDKSKLTAAHKKHPYGTYLRVTRLDNKKSVVVKVIDKGPYIKGRVVDLSRKAAEKIGLPEDGVAEVKVEIVNKSGNAEELAKSTPKKPAITIPEDRPAVYDNQTTAAIGQADNPTNEKAREVPVVKDNQAKAPAPKSESPKGAPDKASSTASSKARLVGQDYTQYGLYKISLERPGSKGFGVQVASLSNYENVLKQVADLQAKWFDNILISVEKGTDKPTYKVILGPFEDEKSAQNYENSLKKKFKIKGFTVNLNEIQY